jgi:short-subunit dehydrogenase
MKTIFITGGTTGIGRAVGEIFKAQGYTVGVCSFQPASEITDLPVSFHYYQADVTNEQAMLAAVNQFVTDHGSLDIIIANAGMNMPKTAIPDTKLGTKITQVNTMGVVYTFNAALPHFLAQKSGHFVAISSLSGLNGLPGMSYYGATKAYVASFCESLAIDLEDHGINVTCVVPGFIKTSFTAKNDHPMPFLLTQEQAAARISKAIQKKKKVDFFPLVPFLFMSLLRKLPRPIYYFIMKHDILKLRQQ